jgi:hypothetical protein
MTKGTAVISYLFEAQPDVGAEYGEEAYPGYPGLSSLRKLSGGLRSGAS